MAKGGAEVNFNCAICTSGAGSGAAALKTKGAATSTWTSPVRTAGAGAGVVALAKAGANGASRGIDNDGGGGPLRRLAMLGACGTGIAARCTGSGPGQPQSAITWYTLASLPPSNITCSSGFTW